MLLPFSTAVETVESRPSGIKPMVVNAPRPARMRAGTAKPMEQLM